MAKRLIQSMRLQKVKAKPIRYVNHTYFILPNNCIFVGKKYILSKVIISFNFQTKKIFVGGVSQETSAEEVKAYFSQFGKVEEAVMLMDQQTKRHRGFGFVTFEVDIFNPSFLYTRMSLWGGLAGPKLWAFGPFPI